VRARILNTTLIPDKEMTGMSACGVRHGDSGLKHSLSLGKPVRWTAMGILMMLVPFLLCSCAPKKPKGPAVPAFNNSALTTTLQKGLSTPTDVRNVLGEPKGSGEFLFPTETAYRTVWFYEKVKIDASSGKIDLQQDVLMVFFKADRFDGFLWFSDACKDW
jgi:hypothetical protein